MNVSLPKLSVRAYFGFTTLTLILGVSALLLLAPPDGAERAQLLQFVGRFHPLSVHLPIAVLFLVALFELAGRIRYFSYLHASVEFLLCVAICGAIFAALLGWCLARGGGLFRPIARATYAGCGPCCDWRVVLLVAASPDRRCALCAVVRLHTHCDAGLGFVYRLSWRPSVAGRESSDAVHAYALAKFVRVVRAAHGSGKFGRR